MKRLALGLLFVSTSAFAQTVLPTAPVPPTIVTTSPNETDANAVATTNKVYIDQQGGNVDVNIVQTGTANIIGSAIDPIYLRGDNQSVIAIQTGNGNQLYMGVVSDTGGTGIATVTVRQIGDLNTADIRCGTLQTDSSCNQLDMNAKFTGNNNSFIFHGSGANIRNSMDFSGNNNTINMDALSPNASQTLLVTGNYNDFDVTQTGTGGTFGHSLYVNLTGSLNTVTTQQYGVSETVININSVGSNGVFNIKTGH
ncbi:MAG: hypothetical protein EBU66_04260 [Bacteroidetes bacterium]|nr:hypothetical protein [bacterium]NBP63881.1 hypothetical protein [Bacteroidota bacterium]